MIITITVTFAEDECIICCEHWKSHPSKEVNRVNKHYPILLLNGYSTESFCLPTEPNDLVRTLLQKGHDVLLLRTRLHPSLNASNDFSIEDIGRMDIPAGKSIYPRKDFHFSTILRPSYIAQDYLSAAAMNKIIELYEESIKVHVVAHCVGGLAIHISIMGGHVSSKHIASLSCTNSSMFFKLTASSSIKMWLPLIPVSIISQLKESHSFKVTQFLF